jgi:hypothetical protein
VIPLEEINEDERNEEEGINRSWKFLRRLLKRLMIPRL